MLTALGSRLTYANVVATGALFLALGGGAYALSGIPDRAGVYHGCASNSTGVLRVVKSARSCQKAKTVRRRGRRVRLPGELAVIWNQQGPRGPQGFQGIQGVQGQKGDQGASGPGAATFRTTASVGPGTTTLAILSNGLTLRGGCPTTGSRVSVEVDPTNGSHPTDESGIGYGDQGSPPATYFPLDGVDSFGGAQVSNVGEADYDGLARDSSSPDNRFARIDLHGSAHGTTGPCTFWGMVIPSG